MKGNPMADEKEIERLIAPHVETFTILALARIAESNDLTDSERREIDEKLRDYMSKPER